MKKKVIQKAIVPEEKAKETATILYQKMPNGMIMITGFPGFMTIDELEKKYGEVISDIYLDYPERVFKTFRSDGQEQLILHSFQGAPYLDVNAILTKKRFSDIVVFVRKCGKLLHEIVLSQTKNKEIRGIKI